MSLVETDWLEKNISSVKIIDCSWHMPQTKRKGLEEYKNQHILNSLNPPTLILPTFFTLEN